MFSFEGLCVPCSYSAFAPNTTPRSVSSFVRLETHLRSLSVASERCFFSFIFLHVSLLSRDRRRSSGADLGEANQLHPTVGVIDALGLVESIFSKRLQDTISQLNGVQK